MGMEDNPAYGLMCALGHVVAGGGMDAVLMSIWKAARECGLDPASISVEIESEGDVRFLIRGGKGKTSYGFNYILPSAPPKTLGAVVRLPHDPNAPPWIVSAGGTD